LFQPAFDVRIRSLGINLTCYEKSDMRPIISLAFLLAVYFTPAAALQAQDRPRMELWPPDSAAIVGEEERDRPSITLYKPERPNGCAVVVCPGGGYGALAVDHEGKQIGEWYNEFGVTAFVLRYRIAPHYRHPTPMLDVQRAIRTVRAKAEEFGVDPERIGVMGFSAGGHLASTAATHFDDGDANADEPIDRVSCRPDFAILCYPVITFTQDFMHRGSRNNLLGKDPEEALVKSLSNELQVTEKTPPTFLFHTWEDKVVPPQNSLVFFLAMKEKGVPGELHIYEKGRHGVGLAKNIPGTQNWPRQLRDWLAGRGLLTKRD
jgi:acetyl esterase/lipase